MTPVSPEKALARALRVWFGPMYGDHEDAADDATGLLAAIEGYRLVPDTGESQDREERVCWGHEPVPDTGEVERLRAALDADDLHSIALALGRLPTWFPETAAKVEALRAALSNSDTSEARKDDPE